MKKIAAVLLLVLLMPVSLLAAGAAMPESYYAQLPELYRRLKTAEGKKLVLVGGATSPLAWTPRN